MKDEVHIVDSLYSNREFFIFRDNGVEVKCIVDQKQIIRPWLHKLKPSEVKAIKNKYNNIERVNLLPSVKNYKK